MKKQLNVTVGIMVSIVGVVLACLSVFLYAWDAAKGIKPIGAVKVLQFVILCGWIVVPPVWFVLEPYLTPEKKLTSALRKSQEPLARVWVGVSAMLGVLASALLK